MRNLTIAIGSRNFFGAERRFLRIVAYLQAHHSEIRIRLVLNSTLLSKLDAVSWACATVNKLKMAGQLVVIPDSIRGLRAARGIEMIPSVLLGSQPTHVVFRARPLAYVRALLNRPSLIEVTSPDVATVLGSSLPLFLAKRLRFRCVSESVQELLLQSFGARRIPRDALSVYCATLPFMPIEEQLPASIKENLVVSASRFLPRKNVVLFASAVLKCAPKLPGWRFLLLGRGDLEADLVSMLAPLIQSGQVQVGYEPNMEALLLRSKLYVSLIEPDNYPSQGVMEAMRSRNALIISDTGRSRRFLAADGTNGSLVDLHADAIADAILAFAARSDLEQAASGAASAKHLAAEFPAERYINEMLEAY